MMRSLHLLTLSSVLFLTLGITFAQNPYDEYDRLTLKFTPSSLVTPFSPAWQFGVEYRPTKYFGIQTDIATNLSGLRYLSKCWECSGQKYYHTNFKWRQEFRWYIPTKSAVEWYFAQEIFALTNNFRLRGGLSRQDSTLYRFDTAEYNRIGIGVASKLGVIYKLSQRTRIEAFAGIGVRFNSASVVIKNEKRIGRYTESDSSPVAFDRDRPTASEILPHISVGFRVGYVLLNH